MAAFHFSELVPGLWYQECLLDDMAYWDTLENMAIINIIGHTCACPTLTN